MGLLAVLEIKNKTQFKLKEERFWSEVRKALFPVR